MQKGNQVSILVFAIVAGCWVFLPVRAEDRGEGPVGRQIVASLGPDRLAWTVGTKYTRAMLTVSEPAGRKVRMEFGSKDALALDLDVPPWSMLSDATYRYELRLTRPTNLEDLRRKGRPVRPSDIANAQRRRSQDRVVLTKIGHFTIRGGRFHTEGESGAEAGGDSAAVSAPGPTPSGPSEEVILGNLIVMGNLCSGDDCFFGEEFGFDTFRLKENNLRIKFEDTSSDASFPTNDWQISVNDIANGGVNRFSIDDVDAARSLFTIEAGAPSHSLYVDDGGRIGLGTSTPLVDLHNISGDTPTFRLEQDGNSGFTPQTWDVAGNEANFFIRDVTNGNTLPFIIRPGAPSNSIYIAALVGDVGMGTTSPKAALHVSRTGGDDTRDLLELSNNGCVRMKMTNTDTGQEWTVGHGDVGCPEDALTISLSGSGGAEFEILGDGTVRMGPGASTPFILAPDGNLQIDGTLTQGSSRALKENIKRPDSQMLLSRLRDLPIAVWNYKTEDPSVRHMGPMAEDFRRAFKLGIDDKHIAPADIAGVALAAIQELQEQVHERDGRITDLTARIDQLECMVLTLMDDRRQLPDP